MNSNSDNTVNQPPSSGGRSFGGRVWGLWEVIHGLGDNIRGTALGAIDTMAHGDSAKYDAIAREGRAEVSRGLANLTGRPHEPVSAVTAGTPVTSEGQVPTEQSTMFAASNYDGDPNMVQAPHVQQVEGAPALPPRRPNQGYGTMN